MTTAMNNTMSTLQEGMDKHRAGDLAGAELIYKSILATTPKNSDAISLLGMVYQGMGREKEALMLMNQSITLSRHFLYLNRRASLLHGMGENKQAIEDAKASKLKAIMQKRM
jgi:tetratricopeptide (TPR) repeat protein